MQDFDATIGLSPLMEGECPMLLHHTIIEKS